jgi:hypothetical protein
MIHPELQRIHVHEMTFTEALSNIPKATEEESRHEEFVVDMSKVQERRLFRKLDLHLIPILTLVYLCSFVDRTNIGASCSL